MNYSFRKKNKIVKYVVIHYTGMKNLKLAYQKLTDEGSNVSAHYLISQKGKIFNLLCPKYKAWHAGKSKWKNDSNINNLSIGIELENKGHDFGYTSFSKQQYISLKKLIFFLKYNFHILDENIVHHSDISPNRKKDPGEKFLINKIGIKRFKNKKKINKKYKYKEMLKIYGFHEKYIRDYESSCTKAVKRSLNYRKISSIKSKKFLNDFSNLLFS